MQRTRLALLAVSSLWALGCGNGDTSYSGEPIELQLAGAGGGLFGIGTAAERQTPFPMLLDTASPLTAYSDGTSQPRATRGALRLFGGDVARLELDDVKLFVTALSASGLDAAQPISGVLGGDNLRRFVLGVSYTPAPRLQLTDQLVLNDCELAEQCAAVLPFSLAGGRQLIDIGDDIFSYPPSYVLLDACLEPALDPLEPGLTCSTDDACKAATESCKDFIDPAQHDACVAQNGTCSLDVPRYLTRGVNVRLAVATGFPGFALTAAAYDRLRGAGSAAALAASPHTLYLPDQSIDAPGLSVGIGTLGRPAQTLHDPDAVSALALVGRRGYFDACSELARSRRLRRAPPEHPSENSVEVACLRSPDRNPEDPVLDRCRITTNSGGVCDDTTEDAHTTPYAEILDTMPVVVVPDTTSLLQSINADVRPESATVEGVIGTELLRRFDLTIDYPRSRVVLTCADPSCRAFPELGHGTDCSPPSGGLAFGGRASRTIAAPRSGAAPISVGCAIP